MTKKLFFVFFTLALANFSFAQVTTKKETQPTKHDTHKGFDPKGSKALYLGKYDPQLLIGFDIEGAKRKAAQRTANPVAQKEVFENLVKHYIASKQPKHEHKAWENNSLTTQYFDLNKGINPLPTPYSGACPNVGFENMNFGNWSGDTYTNSAAALWTSFTPAWVPGVMTLGLNNPTQAIYPAFVNPYPNRQTIMTIPPTLNTPPNCIGWDSIAINPTTGLSDIPFVPSNANGATCRLGNGTNNNNETERLVYSMNVSTGNSQFTYSYAVVIDDGGHATGEQPFFKITARDQNGNPIGGACGAYQIDATLVSTDPNFILAQNSFEIYYKKWTTVGIDLSAYVGQTVTIEFQTGDCIFGGHWCYAYVDASCQPSQITLNYCPGSTVAYAVGPTGYASYQWYGPNNMVPITGAINDSLVVNNGNIGDLYTLIASTASGCTSTMQVTLNPTTVGVQTTLSTPSCATGSSGSASVIPIGSSNGYTYAWTTSTGFPIGTNNAVLSNVAPGTYNVHVSSPGCGFKDTSVIVGITPAIFMSTSQTLCGNPYVINAPAGSNYVWYDASLTMIPSAFGNATLTIPNNGPTNCTVMYTNTTGCKDSMKINVSQQVNFSTQNISFCGNSVTFTAMTGASNITWYDANWPYSPIGNSSSITIPSPYISSWDHYSVSYTNPTTGCKDSIQYNLTQITGSVNASNITNSCLSPSANGAATVNLTTGQTSPYTYVITGNNGYTHTVSNSTLTAIPLTALDTGHYTMTVSAGACSYTGTFVINPITVPVTIATNPLCLPAGGTSTVTFTYGAGGSGSACQTSATGCASPTVNAVGTANSQNTSTFGPSPYGNYYSNEKYQILYTASDLNAAGITAGKISSIAFDVASIPAGMNTTFINYSIKIACTSITDFGPLSWGDPFVTAPFTQVYGPQTYTIATGLNTHNFAQAYEWDGTSSIIVEICYDWVASYTYTTNAIMNTTTTPYTSFIKLTDDSSPTCPQTTISSSFLERPVTKFGHCLSQAVASDFTYNWTPSTGVQAPTSPTNTNPTVNIIPTSTQFYLLTTTSNVGGCTKNDTFTIHVIIPFNLAVTGGATICSNAALQPLQATTTDPVTGAPLVVAGAWTGTGVTNLGNGAGTFNPAAVAPGATYIATYSAGAAACGGTSAQQATALFTVNPYIPATFSSFGPFCVSDPLVVLGPQATNTTGTWTIDGNPATQFDPATLGATAAPGHVVSYTIDQGFGCPDNQSINVMVNADPNVSFTSDIASGCLPSLPVSFTSTVDITGGTYMWTFGDAGTSTLDNPVHVYNQAGVYGVSLTYTSPNGCKDVATTTPMITVHSIPNPDFISNPTNTTTLDPHIYFTNTTVNTAGLVWHWDISGFDTSNLKNTDYEYVDAGEYFVTLTATDVAGCTNSVTHPVYITPDHVLYIPSGFTPNDDGKNDIFIPKGDGVVVDGYKMSIFNRWGEKVFETTDATIGWNGAKFNNGDREECEVYVYRVTFKDQLSKSYTRTGHVTLQR